jgi:glycosyltransferase involved in cell wall biosynthesis
MNLQIVVPCYNEELVLSETARQLDAVLSRLIESGKVCNNSRINLIDDGSRDRTWTLIEQEATTRNRIAGIKLSRNRGHQYALLAGMMSVNGDAVVTIDADLQDDVNAIERMVDKCLQGYDIVYGVRAGRSTDTRFKRSTAIAFYRLLAVLGLELVHNHADFRLMTRRVIEALREYHEVNLYLRGVVPLIGFPSTTVEYQRKERFAGRSKYTISRMIKLALIGITSFSTAPLQLITLIGFIMFVGSTVISGWALWVTFYTDRAVPGWASTVLPMYFLGGLQLLCLGILGAYLGRIYNEVKSRPRYFIDRTIGLFSQPKPIGQMDLHDGSEI